MKYYARTIALHPWAALDYIFQSDHPRPIDRDALTLSLPNLRVCCVSDIHTRNVHASGIDIKCYFFQETLYV